MYFLQTDTMYCQYTLYVYTLRAIKLLGSTSIWNDHFKTIFLIYLGENWQILLSIAIFVDKDIDIFIGKKVSDISKNMQRSISKEIKNCNNDKMVNCAWSIRTNYSYKIILRQDYILLSVCKRNKKPNITIAIKLLMIFVY